MNKGNKNENNEKKETPTAELQNRGTEGLIKEGKKLTHDVNKNRNNENKRNAYRRTTELRT